MVVGGDAFERTSRIELRRWQRAALERWLPERRGVISVVTGAGKTVFALACVQELKKEEPDLQVLIVVPSMALLEQWDRQVRSTLGLAEHEVNLVSSRHRRPRHKTWVTIAVVNSLRQRVDRPSGATPTFLIADECHRYASEDNRRAIKGSWRATLGLSATPRREYDDWFEVYVQPILGDVMFEYSYLDALQDGVLASFELHNYRVPLTPSESEVFDELSARIVRLRRIAADEEAVRRALIRRAAFLQSIRARIPAAIELLRARRGERALVFHESVPAADHMTDLLEKEGHRVVAYHSRMSPASRSRSLHLFETRQADMLVTCRALDEGYDVPDVTFGLVVASTASSRQRTQRLGRVLRKAPGKDTAVLATIYGSDYEAERLRNEAINLIGAVGSRWFEVTFS